VRDLNEIDSDHYTAVLDTKVAYLKFKFNVAVEVVRADPPHEIEAKIEGTPLGIVGRLTASSVTRLAEENGGTKISYEIEAALTGKLGSLGQPVLRSKAKELERQFAERMRAAFAPAAEAKGSAT
jgi:carbon monoxide dehydrogenase subunit G